MIQVLIGILEHSSHIKLNSIRAIFLFTFKFLELSKRSFCKNISACLIFFQGCVFNPILFEPFFKHLLCSHPCWSPLVNKLCAQSCPTPAAPQTVALQAPLSMGFSRQESWSGLPVDSPGHLPYPGVAPESPALQADSTD